MWLYCLLCSITVQTHGNMESINYDTKLFFSFIHFKIFHPHLPTLGNTRTPIWRNLLSTPFSKNKNLQWNQNWNQPGLPTQSRFQGLSSYRPLEVELSCEIYISWRKHSKKLSQFLLSEQPCGPKTLPWLLPEFKNTLAKLAVAVKSGGHLIPILIARRDDGNFCPPWLVFLKS